MIRLVVPPSPQIWCYKRDPGDIPPQPASAIPAGEKRYPEDFNNPITCYTNADCATLDNQGLPICTSRTQFTGCGCNRVYYTISPSEPEHNLPATYCCCGQMYQNGGLSGPREVFDFRYFYTYTSETIPGYPETLTRETYGAPFAGPPGYVTKNYLQREETWYFPPIPGAPPVLQVREFIFDITIRCELAWYGNYEITWAGNYEKHVSSCYSARLEGHMLDGSFPWRAEWNIYPNQDQFGCCCGCATNNGFPIPTSSGRVCPKYALPKPVVGLGSPLSPAGGTVSPSGAMGARDIRGYMAVPGTPRTGDTRDSGCGCGGQ